MKNFAGTFNAGNGCLTAVLNGSIYTVDKTHQNYPELLEAFKTGNDDLFVKLYKQTKVEVKVAEVIRNTGVELVDGKLMYNGKQVHHSYTLRILSAREAGFPIDPMLRFFEKLLQNSSQRSVEEAPDFLMHKNLPITEDGCFLAYKSVQSDWYSKASGSLTLLQGKTNDSGQVYNGVGEVIECLRNEVDDERENECSKGLHVGGLAYSGPGGWYNDVGDKVVICKVDPKDIVSVPKDHNAQKIRVCKYEVVEEFKEALNDHCVGVEANLPPLPVDTYRTITLDSVARLDTITFDYVGRNDHYANQRFMIVEEVGHDYLFGTLLPEDPSYEEGNETRKFLMSGITNLSYYDEDDYEDEEEYDDEDEDDNW